MGLRDALRKVQEEYRILRIHRTNLKRARQVNQKDDLLLHLGCGKRIKAGWVNIDLFSSSADLHLDLREPLPFRDGSVATIYSEHFFEHLAYPKEIKRFLAECLRVLKPGGLFSAGMPDTEKICIHYAQGNEEAFRIARERWHPAWCNTLMHQVNYHFRQGEEHKYAYDFKTLASVLAEEGFNRIGHRRWDAKRDTEGWEGSLYVDAYRPSSPSNSASI
jgi:predicted SAM-dependent methyltransferase